MQFIKYTILFLILVSSSILGKFISRKYVYRLQELEEMKLSLNIIKAKMKFTYEPIPEIFAEIFNNTNGNVANIFKNANLKMNELTASDAWDRAIDESTSNLNNEDKIALKSFSKLLGQTDIQGQISQIEITENFLETQLKDARIQKEKNVKLFTRLGTIAGLAIVIVLC